MQTLATKVQTFCYLTLLSSTSLARHDRAGSRRSISSAVSHQTAYIADAPLGDKRGRGGGIFRLYLARLRRSPVFWACLVGSILRGMELPLCAYFAGLSYSALEQTAETFTSFMWLAVGSNIFLALYSWAFLTISVSTHSLNDGHSKSST
ncbi:hypothetical protein GCK32_019506 [Trichostrongylus colubriformis]|uniref:Uncharacterized protein n=1 Tax=Trichostrongylus colubriformis TaxID=6319 RepID=A0AAN8FSM0_TRICO